MTKTNGKMGNVLERVRNVVAVQSCRDLADHELLQRYVAEQDESAFAVLAKRHGSIVLGLCMRVLRHQQDAEDAFQAAFLVFARKAGTIRKSESIASWLYSVAFRAANKLRAAKARRSGRQAPLVDVPRGDFSAELCCRETLRVLEEELNRLADRYRAPLLLCCVEGRTRDEAAQQLGWSLGVLRGRLDRGREMLRARLARRGVSLSVALLALGVSGTAQAAPALLSSTILAATGAARTLAAASAVSAQATALAQGVIQAMFISKVKIVAVGLLTSTFLAAGAGFVTYQAQAQDGGPGARLEAKRDTKPPSTQEMTAEQMKREIERLRLELEQTRLLLQLANKEILELRAAKAVAAHRAKAERDLVRKLADQALSERDVAERARRALEAFAEKEAAERAAALKALAGEKALKPHLGVASPDGKIMAVAQGKLISLIDVATGKEIRSFNGHSDDVSSMAFAPSGKYLASGSKDKSVALWDILSGKLIAKFSHQEPVIAVAFSPDGRHVVVRGKRMTSEIDANTGKLIRVTKEPEEK
jgi:RNA polymerase sigma factor (sigma-70 family)